MKTNKNISLLLVAVLSIVTFYGCVKDLTHTLYNGPDLIEFAPVSKTVTTVTGSVKLDSAVIQLVGPQRSTPTNVTFSVNGNSKAIAGVDYTILTTSPVAIPANSSSVSVYINFNKVSSARTLILDLQGGDNVTISQNYKNFTFNIR